jgi:hypothetical protein
MAVVAALVLVAQVVAVLVEHKLMEPLGLRTLAVAVAVELVVGLLELAVRVS